MTSSIVMLVWIACGFYYSLDLALNPYYDKLKQIDLKDKEARDQWLSEYGYISLILDVVILLPNILTIFIINSLLKLLTKKQER